MASNPLALVIARGAFLALVFWADDCLTFIGDPPGPGCSTDTVLALPCRGAEAGWAPFGRRR